MGKILRKYLDLIKTTFRGQTLVKGHLLQKTFSSSKTAKLSFSGERWKLTEKFPFNQKSDYLKKKLRITQKVIFFNKFEWGKS